MQSPIRRTLMSAALLAVPLHAQVSRPSHLTSDGARRVIGAAVAEASRLNTTGVIAVVDDGGNLMALERIDNTFAAGANISIGKARTAVLFQKPTRVFEDIIKDGRTPMIALNDFTPLQGGVPIMVDGEIVGGVGVSGAASAPQDEQLAMAGAAAFTRVTRRRRATRPRRFTPGQHEQVAAAFAKGAVLYDGDGTHNYMVHASRREGPGMAEVHAKDTDIIYVLGGSARLVTGGNGDRRQGDRGRRGARRTHR